ncbi:SDR family oxidoreductase, partial [Endobacter medicaginis]
MVLITGCSSGIGRALAEEFLRRGQPVVATARRSTDLTPLSALGATVAALDITDRGAAENLLAVLAADGIEIDMLVNNAGFGAMGPLAELSDAQWRRQFDVNLFAPMALTRLVLPRMIARRTGCIVNIGSISGEVPTPFSGAYCASKAAFNAASDVLRMELAPFGVKVVSVLPGGIASSFGDTASAGATLAPGSAYAPWADAIA